VFDDAGFTACCSIARARQPPGALQHSRDTTRVRDAAYENSMTDVEAASLSRSGDDSGRKSALDTSEVTLARARMQDSVL
jgi:hypothetical protein